MPRPKTPEALTRYGQGGGTTPAWVFRRRTDGFWELLLAGGCRRARIALRPEEFVALAAAFKTSEDAPPESAQ